MASKGKKPKSGGGGHGPESGASGGAEGGGIIEKIEKWLGLDQFKFELPANKETMALAMAALLSAGVAVGPAILYGMGSAAAAEQTIEEALGGAGGGGGSHGGGGGSHGGGGAHGGGSKKGGKSKH